MVTYMEPQTAPSYMTFKCTCWTLRKPNFMRVPHAQPSLSNISKWDLNLGEPSHSHGTTRLGQNFPTSGQNQNTKLTHCSIYMSIRSISFPQTKRTSCSPELGSHKGANHELLKVYSKPQTGPLPRLLGSYLSSFSAHNLSKLKYLISLFQHTSTVECRSCVVYAQYNNLCQFGLLSQAYQPISPSILIHFWWELYQINSLIVRLPS